MTRDVDAARAIAGRAVEAALAAGATQAEALVASSDSALTRFANNRIHQNVASSDTWRARSLRKIAAPLSTPTKITDWPRKSRVISAPISATRLAI